eukprot:3649859-Amphidinium_carterae.1
MVTPTIFTHTLLQTNDRASFEGNILLEFVGCAVVHRNRQPRMHQPVHTCNAHTDTSTMPLENNRYEQDSNHSDKSLEVWECASEQVARSPALHQGRVASPSFHNETPVHGL